MKFETHDKGTIFTEAGSSTAQGAIKVNTTLDDYGSITVRDKKDVNEAISAFQVENASNGTNETNLLLRSVNLGSTAFSHGIYAAKSHRFAVSSNTTPTVQVDTDGLKFNNDQASANALDDYEEGTWTPSTTEGMNNVYGAHYVKVGAKVSVQAYITMPTSSSGNNIRIDSFPFTSKGSNHYAIGTAYSQWSGTDHIFIQLAPSATHAYVYRAVGSSVTFADGSGGYFLFSMTYFTA